MNSLDKVAFNFRNIGGKAPNFFPNAESAALKAKERINRYKPDDIKKHNREEVADAGNGMFIDPIMWGVGKISPKAKEKVVGKLTDFKEKVVDVDQKAAQRFIDFTKMKQGGMMHKFFTHKKPVAVAETVPFGDTTLQKRKLYDNEARLPSLLAPAQNTARVATPLLASMYVGEKMYPVEEQVAFEEFQQGLEKIAVLELDKTAALQKAAQLEEKLEITTGMLKAAHDESRQFLKALEKETLEKQAAMSKTAQLERALKDSEQAHEELVLRTKARERSKHAVKIAESMLESGMIKQAEFDERVDFLMDCDDKTFNLYTFISKNANNEEKLLETSSLIVETIGRDDNYNPKKGISKKGQTIGEAALDLIR